MNTIVNLKDGFITFNSNIDYSLSFSKCAIGYSNYNINSHERGSLVFLTNNNADTTNISMHSDVRMCISSDGNVGIGTINPLQKLDIIGNTNISRILKIGGINQNENEIKLQVYSSGTANNLVAIFKHPNDSQGIGIAYDSISALGSDTNNTQPIAIKSKGNANIVLNTNSIDRLTINGNGNIGIGTTNPNANLHLHGDGASQNVRISFTDNTSGPLTTDGFCIGKDSVQKAYIYNCEYADLDFGTNNIERLRIKANGNIGIGTDNALSKLHIHTNALAQDVRIILSDNTSTTSTTRGLHLIKYSDNFGYLWNYENTPLIFATTNIERIRITAEGNIGIGTITTFANAKLHVEGNTYLNGFSTINGNLQVNSNIVALTYSGIGSNITNINAENISAGTLPVGRGGTGTTTLGVNQILIGNAAGALISSPNLSWNNTTNTLNSTNLTTTNLTTGVSDTRLLVGGGANPVSGFSGLTWNSGTNTLNATIISGIGSNITNINAENISTGTLNNARLPIATTSLIGAVKKGNNIDISGDGTISVNLTSYTGDTSINGNLVVNSNLIVHGTSTTLNTDVYTTERLELSYNGTISPTFIVKQTSSGNTNNILNIINSTTSNVFNISSSGNIGIGTTNPTSRLHIPTPDPITNFSLLDFRNVANFGIYATSTAIGSRGNTIDFLSTDFNNSGGIQTRNILSLRPEGNVGIGITNPTELLHVNGNFRAAGSITSGSGADIMSGNHIFTTASTCRLGIGINPNTPTSSIVHLHRTTTNTEIKLQFTDGTTLSTGTDGLTLYKGTDQHGYLWNYENNALIFGTNSTEKMRISADGNVGIGMTNPVYRCHIKTTYDTISSGLHLDADDSTPASQPNRYALTLYSYVVGVGQVGWRFRTQSNVGGTQTPLQFDNAGNVAMPEILQIGSLTGGAFNNTIRLRVYASDASGTCAIFKHPNDSQGIGIRYNEIYGTNTNQNLNISTTGTGVLIYNTSGAERMRISAGGNIGIGTTNPNHLLSLHINNTTDTGRISFTNNNTTGGLNNGFVIGIHSNKDSFIWQNENNAIQFGTNGVERMKIANDGNVGIGTTNPINKLDIQGAAAQTLRILDTRATGDAIIALKETNDNNGFDMAYIGTTGDRFYIRGYNNSATPRVDFAIDRITSNVGIGMTNPGYKLDVAGTINASNILINGSLVTANNQWTTSGTNIYNNNTNNIGIGTNNPISFLHLHKNTANTEVKIHLTDTTSGLTSSDGLSLYKGTDQHGYLWNYENNALIFGTNATEKLRILANGNVGIGTNNPSALLDIVYSPPTIQNIDMLNIRTDGNWGLKVQQSYTIAGNIQFNIIHRYNTIDYNSLTFKGANVGIGTTNPQRNLHVQSSLRIGGNGACLDFGDDLTTQIYRNGILNELRFTTNTIDRITIGSDGNVGIGTTNPTNKLDIQGAAAQTLRILDTRATGDAIIALKETNDNNGFDMAYIGTTGDRFYIRGYNNSATPRVDFTIDRITSNVGIGMTNPGYKLDVAGTINASNILINGSVITANSSQWTTSGTNIYTNLSGNVGIGTTTPTGYKLTVNGTIGASGNITASYSDERLKNITEYVTDVLPILNKINVFKYNCNELAASFGYDMNKKEIGLSAQEIQKYYPEVVSLAPFDAICKDEYIFSKSGNNYLTLDYERLVPVLLQGIKDLNNIVVKLQDNERIMQNEINNIKMKLEKLEL